MTNLSVSKQDQGIVVFSIWQFLPYPIRMVLSSALLLAGFAAQFLTLSFFPGCLGLLLGNLLLIVKGYDNRVKITKFSPDASWEKVNPNKFTEVELLDRNIKKWDRSLLDITSGRGFTALLVLFVGIGIIYFRALGVNDTVLMTIVYDAILLLAPHWVTGIRKILTKPNMIVKISTLKKVLKTNADLLSGHEVDYYMLLAGDHGKIPDDVKIRIHISNQHSDFLGLYGQVVINQVNGTAYPYFYVVLVAKKGFGLEEAFNSFTPPAKITKEFKTEGDVEVFVIRQTTSKTSGYHTSGRQMAAILSAGIKLSEHCARK